ncbi:tape measure protein [Elizabethkingia anophelis]|uniref:tape measure protein n=1 Tax=Elizabethkingia anophelis TaxID=1117645 RepID=UPI0038928406
MAELNVGIGADISELKSGLRDAENQLSSFANKVQNISNLGSKLQGVGTALTAGITIPLIGLGVAAIKSYGDIEALQKGLEAVLGSADRAKEEFSKLKEVARLPGLGMEEAVKGSINLQSIGISADKSRNILQQFGNAVATVGKGRAEFERAIYGVQQLANTDFPLGEDLNIIKDALPQISNLLKDAFGTSRSDELSKLGISSQQVLDVILQGLEKLPRVTGGIKGAFENLGDSVKNSLARVGEIINKNFDISGIINKISDGLDKVISYFENLSPEIQSTIVVLGSVAAAAGPLIAAVGTFMTMLPTLIAGVEGVGAALAALTGPVGLVTIGIIGIVAAVTTNWGKIKPYIIDTINYFIRLYNESLVVRAAAQGIATAFKNQFAIVGNVLKAAWEVIKTFAKGVADTFSGVGNIFEGAFTADPTKITKGINQMFSAQINTAKSLGNDMINLFKNIYKDLKSNVVEGIDNVVNFKPIALVNDISISMPNLSSDTEKKAKNEISKGLKSVGKSDKKDSFKIELPDITPLMNITDSVKKRQEDDLKWQESMMDMREKLYYNHAESIKNAMPELTSAYTEAQLTIAELNANINEGFNDILTNSIASGISDTFSSIGEAIASGGDVVGAIGNSLISAFGSFLSEMGDMLIKYGTLAIIKGKLDTAIAFGGPTAIAAGIAAVAIGAALKLVSGAIGARSKGGFGGSSSNTSTATGANTTMYSSNYGGNNGFSGGEVVFRISGNDLVGVLNQEQNRQRRTNS